MHLLITGASGYLATEVLRQALSHPQITSVTALARQKIEAPAGLKEGADVSKLRSVVLGEDGYGAYGEDVREALKGVEACIWTVAVTPSKSKKMDFADLKRICLDYTMLGLRTIDEARGEGMEPLRFVYVSGAATERDQSKRPGWMPEYSLMRGDTENQILIYAQTHNIIPCIVKPGLITDGSILKCAFATLMSWTGMVGNVRIEEIAAVMLEDVVKGIMEDTVENDKLVEEGREILRRGHEL